MKNIDLTIVDRLLLIEKDYITSKAFAEALGISPQALWNYTSGNANVGKIFLARIERLGYNTDWLLYGRGEKKLNDNSNLGTLFDNEIVESSLLENDFKQISMPSYMNMIYVYPYSLNVGNFYEPSLLGTRIMFVSETYDKSKIIAFQNAVKEIPERGILNNSTILVDITLNPIENDIIIAVKENELILDIYKNNNHYDKIIGVMIEVNTKNFRR